MEPTRWKPVRQALGQFHSYLAPHILPFEIRNATDWQWSDKQYDELRPSGFPTHLRGIYLLFDKKEVLLYVGVAMVNFEKRVWSHDKWLDRRWIDIIPIQDKHLFLAPSLEFFLICRLRPTKNTSFSGYTVPDGPLIGCEPE